MAAWVEIFTLLSLLVYLYNLHTKYSPILHVKFDKFWQISSNH